MQLVFDEDRNKNISDLIQAYGRARRINSALHLPTGYRSVQMIQVTREPFTIPFDDEKEGDDDTSPSTVSSEDQRKYNEHGAYFQEKLKREFGIDISLRFDKSYR